MNDAIYIWLMPLNLHMQEDTRELYLVHAN